MNTREQRSLFGVATIPEYIELCRHSVRQFEDEPDMVLHGFSAILALNHIPDWLQYKLTPDQRMVLNLTDSPLQAAVKNELENENPDLKLIRQVANGFKHLKVGPSTDRIQGYGAGPFGVGPYGQPYLLIDLGEDLEPSNRWNVASALCRETINWWDERLAPILQPSATSP